MHLSKVNEALEHKITGGSDYCWTCWDNARFLDYETDYAHASVVFNTKTQEVYCAEVNDKDDKFKPYRWLNPFFKEDFFKESKDKNIDPTIAWDKIKWIDLETTQDWLTKANAIMEGKPFDERVEVPIELEDDLLLQLALEAHKKDITLNKMIENILQKLIDTEKQNY